MRGENSIMLGYISSYEYVVIEHWSGGFQIVATFQDRYSAILYASTKNQQSDGSLIYDVSEHPVYSM